MSRCGSTLLAQSLTALPDSVVLSEPEAVDTLLQWLNAMPHGYPARSAELLRALLSALGQPRRAEDRRLFLKTDCAAKRAEVNEHLRKISSLRLDKPYAVLEQLRLNK